MRYSDAVSKFIVHLRTIRRSPWTQEGYQIDLDHLEGFLPRNTVLCLTREVIEDASGQVSQATLCRRQSAIRSFCKWGMRERLWTENPAAYLKTIPLPDRLPRPFDGTQAQDIMQLELPDIEDLARALLAYTGLRVGALASITVGAISFTDEGARIRIVTKGRREQTLEAHPVLATKLAAYRLAHPHAQSHDPLLANPYGRPYTARTIRRWTVEWGRACGIEKCTPHRFRHEFGTRLWEETGDLRLVQEAMGHRSIQSTVKYTRVTSTKLRAAISRLSYGEGR